MKKILIILTICLLFSGCSLNEFINNSATTFKTNYGTYSIPSTWVKRNDHSTRTKYFFANRSDKNNPPNNISVELGKNNYKAEDHMLFRTALLLQLGNQAKTYGMTLTSNGSNTNNGYVVYTFTLKGTNLTKVQHYIVGNYKYVLVHETIFNGDEADTHNAANEIINSFKWKE